jgi:hypothetical protein
MRFLIVAMSALCLVACDQESGCEEAKERIEPLIEEVCMEQAYAPSPFCSCCVPNGFYSVDNDCTCRPLLFNATACFYSTDRQAKPQVREAIEFANSICTIRKPALPWPLEQDAGGACRSPAILDDSDSGASGLGVDASTAEGGAGGSIN